AALVAKGGFTGAPSLDDEPFGFFHAFPAGDTARIDAFVSDLGSRWAILENVCLPYPCDALSHPAIEAALDLREATGDPKRVTEIRVRSHPLVSELAGIEQPRDAFEAARSTAHG